MGLGLYLCAFRSAGSCNYLCKQSLANWTTSHKDKFQMVYLLTDGASIILGPWMTVEQSLLHPLTDDGLVAPTGNKPLL